MEVPDTRYAMSGAAHVAYQVVGDGPVDVVLIEQWFSHVESQWDVPPLARFLERLSSFSRLLLFDQRGVGLSDPVPISSLPSGEEWMDDLGAVLDAAGSTRAALVAGLDGGQIATRFAATHPDRVSSLVLVNTCPRFREAPDYPWGGSPDQLARALEEIEARWGEGVTAQRRAPSVAADPYLLRAFGKLERQSASPGSALAMMRMLVETDIRSVLPTIRVPTLVIHRSDAAVVPVAHGRFMAEHIPGARFVELPGADITLWAGDAEALVAEIQEFITGVRPPVEADRVLATVMFTDIVGSTDRAAGLGDGRWGTVLEEHNRLVRRQLERFRGREVKLTGDGFLATFDGPARGIRCAEAIRDALRALDLEVRAGLHTGEVSLVGDDVAGIAVHIAARVAALAGAGEILVSSTVRDLVGGSGIEFDDRGEHALKGVPDPWRVFAAR